MSTKLTKEEAIRILSPETSVEELSKYSSREEKIDAVNTACVMGAEALRQIGFGWRLP